MKQSDTIRPIHKIVKVASLNILMALLLEVFVFNFSFWESIGYESVSDVDYVAGTGMQKIDDDLYVITDPQNAFVTLTLDEVELDNLNLDLDQPSFQSSSWRNAKGPFIPYHISAADASSISPIVMPKNTFAKNIPATHWLRVHLSGKASNISVHFDGNTGDQIKINSISINTPRPLVVSFSRVLLVVAVVTLVIILRPKSKLHMVRLDRNKRTLALVCVTTLLECLTIYSISRVAGVSGSADTQQPLINGSMALDFNQYNHLADSLLEGKAYLDLPVSEELAKLDNPYDAAARSEQLNDAGEYYYMDYAFYNGKYYSYFGVLPALTMFVPFKIATGHDLQTANAVSFLAMAMVVSSNVLALAMLKRFSKAKTAGSYLLMSLSLFSSSGLVYLAYLPQLYSIPILSGLICAFLGLTAWLSAHVGQTGRLSKSRLAAGGILIALSMACRPQYLLACILAFPIFWNDIVTKRTFFSKKGIGNTVSVILPFIIVAIPTMYYNSIRFGSPFDFGAAYNLTGSDMTSRGIMAARSIPAVFQYLFMPPNISAAFPYISTSNMNVDFQGFWFFEPFLGGLLFYAPLCIALLCMPKLIKTKNSNGALGFSMVSLCLALFILFADFQVASITMRYFSDFAWLLLLSTWTVLLTKEERIMRNRNYQAIIVTMVLFGLAANMWCLLADGRYAPMIETCPSLYYTISSWLLS